MKKYTLTATINIHFSAESPDQAEQIAQDLGATFSDPRDGNAMNQDWIDWEIKEQH
jgi:capsular polysaccharide biosynthesis protein